MGLLDIQLERLRARAGDFQRLNAPGIGSIIELPVIELPAGWNKSACRILFVVPEGYPFAKPDCFWADSDLRLAGGGVPQNAQINNPIPGKGELLLWFSWHVEPWNPNRDDLVTWYVLINRRLSQTV
jgi:hypothetical protein